MLLPVISVCISTIWTELFPDQVSLPAEASTSAEKSWAGSGGTPGVGSRTGSQSRDQRAASPPPTRTLGGEGPRVKAVELSWTEHLNGSSHFKRHGSIMFRDFKKNALDSLSLTVSSCLDPLQITWPQGGWRGGKLAGL